MRLLPMIVATGAFAAATSASSTRVLELIEGAYEAFLADVVLPASTAGFVTLPPCSTCPPISLGVDASTLYVVESSAVAFPDFVVEANTLARSGRARRAAVYVFYDLDTKRVTRLVLDDLDAS